jgi:transmembrane protein TMEM260 (protein O-mannosyltransferase)
LVRRGLPALTALFLVAHLVTLPRTFDDIDAINFALGVRDFNVAQHQPHPPGYPLYIALGKISTPLVRAAGVAAPEVRGLALWSALGGTALVLLLFGLWRTLDGSAERAGMAAVIAGAAPLFWFTSLRSLSDVPGLCVAVTALWLTLRALPGQWTGGGMAAPRALLAGAFVAGLATGFRSQTAVLTGPLLTAAIVLPGSGVPARLRLGALGAGAAGVAVWAVPLLIASGGLAEYLAALGSQAGEDFSGVAMLWTHRSARAAVAAVLNTFALPWDAAVLAGVILALAAAGLLALAVRAPRRLLLLLLMFGPYAVFHLLFQETVTVRYALPLVLPAAYLVAVVLSEARRSAAATGLAAIVATCLWCAVPAGAAYGRLPSPIAGALAQLQADSSPTALVGAHRRIWTESRRARHWSGDPPGRLLASPRDYEWLELTRALREEPAQTASWLADPRRTDLVLFDPEAQRRTAYRWPFTAPTYVGGARPSEVDLVAVSQPGWFLEQGWALSPEVAGITQRDGWGPHVRPSVGWVRRRAGETRMLIGGRHLGGASDPPVRLRVAIDDRPVVTFDVAPGFFVRFETLPPGTLAGPGAFARLAVTASSPDGSPGPRLALEQFNLQDPGTAQVAFDEGWQEPEYNPDTGRSWRWMSERATLTVHHGGRDVQLRIAGESSLPYFSRASLLTVTVAGEQVAQLQARRDFVGEVTLPAALLDRAAGKAVLSADQMFRPGDREGSQDLRHLALRIYSVAAASR